MTLTGSYLLAFVIICIASPLYMNAGANFPQSISFATYTAMFVVIPLVIFEENIKSFFKLFAKKIPMTNEQKLQDLEKEIAKLEKDLCALDKMKQDLIQQIKNS